MKLPTAFSPVVTCFFPRLCLLQSCHLCDEDEGGEEVEQGAEDEMSFEVRQTELVWGGQGQGTGTHWSSSS